MNLYYNTTSQCRVDENNVRIAAKPVLHYAACPEWVLHFYSGDPSETPVPVDLSDIVSWRAAVDSDWNGSTEPMCRTLAADIDASGKAEGVIRVPVNANTARYLAVVQGKQSVNGWFELRGFDDGGNVALVCLLTITCYNAIDPTGGAEPEPVENDTATMTWVRAIVAQQLYYQYSADGSTWHNPPMVSWTDAYFRVKHGADGVPSEAQLIPYGAAAGFGTPTATATTLNPGDSATAAVTASGTNTAKVFAFDFGIPPGVPAGFDTPTATATTLDGNSSATAAVTASGPDTAKVFAFEFGIPAGAPAGTVHAFAGDAANIPSGYLLCNGASISRETYASLFSAIGTIYGAGNGSTTFNLPDFRGKFLRGYQSGTSAELGTAQGDAIRNIRGSIGYIQSVFDSTDTDFPNTATSSLYGTKVSTYGTVYNSSNTQRDVINLYFDASRNVTTATENRPANYAVNYIIKY